MNRPYQWQATGEALHAIPNTQHDRFPPLPGARYQVLCGGTVTLEHQDFAQGVHHPMCVDCSNRWVMENESILCARGGLAMTGPSRRPRG